MSGFLDYLYTTFSRIWDYLSYIFDYVNGLVSYVSGCFDFVAGSFTWIPTPILSFYILGLSLAVAFLVVNR